LSPSWFVRAFEHANRVVLSPECSCRLQFDIDGVLCALVVSGGTVLRFGVGVLVDPDVVLRISGIDAWAIATGRRAGTDALRAIAVVSDRTDMTCTGLPVPMGLVGRPELAAMPVVPDATLTLYHRFVGGPFGEVEYTLGFVDGQLVDECLGPPDEPPDVMIEASFRKLALLRAGRCTVLDALEHGGSVNGTVPALMAAAALYEHEAFSAAMRATGPQAMALATLGELTADDGFRDGMQALMHDTLRPTG
jgi:hypothetical protein